MPETLIEGYELFQFCGNFGGTESASIPIEVADLGDGFHRSALYGEKTGTKTFTLTFKNIIDTLDRIGYIGTDEFSEAKWVWDFYIRHRQANTPFVIQSNFNNQYYLVSFTDESITYEQFAQKLYTTGLKMTQRRVRDVSVFAGYLVSGAIRHYDASAIDQADNSNVTEWTELVSANE